ncbi:hypothetical protein BGZ70_000656 [Mortierella alpina]|uniref:Pyridoxamine 5'-phosphate oxidase N-terminal domain-containing protein n=1 Tax=Mortierella alpina TaxID=64518 RepID=A0A9P6LYD4_MORAP|nr:hypothetical protein BGZ70_000656 [Mortierella alpina]
MGKFYDEIPDDLAAWMRKQKLFFVATAPLVADGTVNASPKGYDSFRILGPNRVAYLDLTGSGIETLCHLQENGRITFLFMAFDGAPRILRLFGRGCYVPVDSPEYKALFQAHFHRPAVSAEGSAEAPYELEGASQIRGIVVADIHKVGTSCGWAVPYYEFKGERPTLMRFWGKRSQGELAQFWAMFNTKSLDGLPGLRHELMGPEWVPARGPQSAESAIRTAAGKHQTRDDGWQRRLMVQGSLVVVGFSAGLAVGALLG